MFGKRTREVPMKQIQVVSSDPTKLLLNSTGSPLAKNHTILKIEGHR